LRLDLKADNYECCDDDITSGGRLFHVFAAAMDYMVCISFSFPHFARAKTKRKHIKHDFKATAHQINVTISELTSAEFYFH